MKIINRFGRLFAGIALIAGIALTTGCTQIDTGNVGVSKTGGQFKAEELQPGWHLSPISTVFEVSGKQNALSFNDIRPKTSDQITVEDLDMDIYFRLNTAKAQETMVKLAGDLGQNADGDYVPGRNYMTRTAREAIYNAVARVKSNEAQARRAEIPGIVVRELQKELDDAFGKDWWVIESANLRNLTVDSKLEAKIRENANVDYEISTREKQVKLAEAEARRLAAIAQGEADAARIRAESLSSNTGANYLRLLELQNQEAAIKKWNGVMPSTVAGGAPAFLPLK